MQNLEYSKENSTNELVVEIGKRVIKDIELAENNSFEFEIIEKFHMLPMEKPEIRKAYFLKDFNRTVEDMMIMSFGSCNYDCPYCKRDGQFKDENNNIVRSSDYSWDLIKTRLDDSAGKGMKVRLSGGDPCMYPKESLQIAEYMSREHNQKISIAHNGGSPKFVEKILPYLDYAAIDIKGDTNEELCFRAGIAEHDALTKVFESINLCADNNFWSILELACLVIRR